MADDIRLKRMLDAEAARRNRPGELDLSRPDPLLVARKYHDESIALVCALFGYGNAKAIVAFLSSLDFDLLEKEEKEIQNRLAKNYYRFQKSEDIIALFIALRRLRSHESLESIFLRSYRKEMHVLEGISALIEAIEKAYAHQSRGYRFLLGRPWQKGVTSPYKRWNMYLRWMVRKDALDMGLWQGVRRADLLIPLDTHTFHVSHRLGLLRRRQYDLKAVLELTTRLKTFDPEDPVKYDFALYRLGQEDILAALN